jgi:spermidine/putrescine transport system substrate-binding protein
MRKLFLPTLLLILALSAVGGSLYARETAWVCPEGYRGQTLRIFNWSTYVAPNTIPDFEQACGVTVEYFEFASSEEALNVIRSGSAAYDIVVPAANTAAIMIRDGLAQPLNKDLIPNLDNLSETFRNQPFDVGNEYSVAYQWGTIGIGYDRELTGQDLTSWADFFAYEGTVAWLDDPRAILGIALLLQGLDPNSTDPDEIAGAARYLLETNRSDIFQIAPDMGQDLLARGDVDAVIEYNGDIFQLITECGCDNIVYVIPEEGTAYWSDNIIIPTNAPNPNLANIFIDYILDPQVGADLSNFIQYATPNAASLELLDEALRTNPGIYPSEETLAKSFEAIEIGEAERLYSEAWNRLNAELGAGN